MSDIHLMSWNVRYFSHHTRGVTSTEANLRRAAAAVAHLDPQPDILALQEVDNESIRSGLGRRPRWDSATQLDRFLVQLNLQSAMRDGHAYRAVFYRAHGHHRRVTLYSTGLAVLYREGLELVADNRDRPLDITHRRIASLARLKQTRICAFARLRDERGRELDLYNTHLSLPAFLKRPNNETGNRFGESDNQLHEIRAVTEFLMAQGQPERAVLVGDFNARPGSLVYRQILEHCRLRDAYADYHGLTCDELALIPSAGFLQMRFRLDHMFAGPAVALRRFHMAEPYGPTHPMNGLSDHVPLMASLDVDPAAAEVERVAAAG